VLREVIDTSSLVSYVLTRGEITRQIIAHWRASSFRQLSTSATRAELAAVLQRSRIQRLAVAPLDELAADWVGSRITWPETWSSPFRAEISRTSSSCSAPLRVARTIWSVATTIC